METVTVWIIGDQLSENHPALTRAIAEHGCDCVRVLLVESTRRLQHLPYQRKKLVLLLSAMRHFSAELNAQNLTVDYIKADSFRAGVQQHVAAHRPSVFYTMASASYSGRMGQHALQKSLDIPVHILPNTQFLTGQFNPIPEPAKDKRYVMETFYRAMRRHFGLLMTQGKPEGGQWNFDRDNRKKLPKGNRPPPDPLFEPDEITRQVMVEVAAFEGLVGSAKNFSYAVTRQQALQALANFIEQRADAFGPYEDALTTRSHSLYHSLLSPYLNIGLLTPLEVVQAMEMAYRSGRVPINSAEGFIRQIIGWREFMYWQYWRQMPGMTEKNAWEAHNVLPDFVWSGNTNMRCMQHAIQRAIDTGYNHHIERLMVLSNYFMLTGVNPKQVNDWFLSLYIDAYEWVMPPNVIGMSLNADGGLTATKPYIASANYINKMSDYCKPCAYNHKARTGQDACPFNFLYWNFILKHEARLRKNPRTSRSVLGLRYLDENERIAVQKQAQLYLDAQQGGALAHHAETA
ncbi:MAG: cryptochrome/photolyase family protein [Candidatus Promineifilaceae bacterium]